MKLKKLKLVLNRFQQTIIFVEYIIHHSKSFIQKPFTIWINTLLKKSQTFFPILLYSTMNLYTQMDGEDEKNLYGTARSMKKVWHMRLYSDFFHQVQHFLRTPTSNIWKKEQRKKSEALEKMKRQQTATLLSIFACLGCSYLFYVYALFTIHNILSHSFPLFFSLFLFILIQSIPSYTHIYFVHFFCCVTKRRKYF